MNAVKNTGPHIMLITQVDILISTNQGLNKKLNKIYIIILDPHEIKNYSIPYNTTQYNTIQ